MAIVDAKYLRIYCARLWRSCGYAHSERPDFSQRLSGRRRRRPCRIVRGRGPNGWHTEMITAANEMRLRRITESATRHTSYTRDARDAVKSETIKTGATATNNRLSNPPKTPIRPQPGRKFHYVLMAYAFHSRKTVVQVDSAVDNLTGTRARVECTYVRASFGRAPLDDDRHKMCARCLSVCAFTTLFAVA